MPQCFLHCEIHKEMDLEWDNHNKQWVSQGSQNNGLLHLWVFLSSSYLKGLKSQDECQTTLPSYFSLSRQLSNKTEDSKWSYRSRKLSHYCDKETTVDSHKQASACLMGLKRYRKNVVKRQHKVLHYTEILMHWHSQNSLNLDILSCSRIPFCSSTQNHPASPAERGQMVRSQSSERWYRAISQLRHRNARIFA